MDKKDKNEIKKATRYDKLQKAIRIVGIILSVVFILNLQSNKWTDRLLDFNMTVPYGIDSIHGHLFTAHIGNVTTSLSQGVTVALSVAIASFVLSWVWKGFDNDVWYKYQNLALCICGFAGVFYPVANLMMGGGKLVSSGFSIAVYVIVVIITIIFATYNIIKFKDKKDVYATEKKLLKMGPMVLIGIASLGAFIYPVVKLADEYKEVREIKQLIDSHPEGYQEDVEQQMGNYASGKAFSYDGKIYLVDKISDNDEKYGVYRIDKEGNYDLFWQLEEERKTIEGLVTYDGYLYVHTETGNIYELKSEIVRVSLDGKNEEVVVSTEGFIRFGIADGKLMYSEQLVQSEKIDDYATVYTIDLNKKLDESNKMLYDKGLYYTTFDSATWLNIMLYNKYDGYYKYYYKYPQSYENAAYLINDNRELIKTIYPVKSDGSAVTSDDDYSHAIDSNVYAYNIYDGRIYYVKASDKGIYNDNELWSCDMNGGYRKKIGTFPSNLEEDEGTFVCEGLYVTEDFVVCDFNRGKNTRGERYLMKIDGGYRWLLDWR